MKQPQSLPFLETTSGKSNIYILAVMMNILVNEIDLLPVIRISIQIVNVLISISYYKTATFYFYERNHEINLDKIHHCNNFWPNLDLK